MTGDEFRRRMAELPEPVTDKQPPYWEFWRHQLWRLAQVDDPYKFTLWPCVYHTMLVNHWPEPVEYEFSQLDNQLKGCCYVPHCGPDDGIITDNGYMSKNLIHQAYHLWQWQQATGRKINDLTTIVEFGGGYGAMALLCHRLGFKGRYVIYDLPEFSLLQEWYLSQYGIKAEWNPKKYPRNIDLFMALYSLSEVEPDKRMGYLPSQVNSYLFLYSGQWEEWNNVEWFQDTFPAKWRQLDSVQWKHIELTHLPDRNNWYSIGW